MESQIQMILIPTNIKSMLLEVMVCVHDRFSKPYKAYLGENTVYIFQ